MGQGPAAVGGPRALPPGWQQPANLPNFNFSAPVIRLGTQGQRDRPTEGYSAGRRETPGMAGGRRGLGMERDGDRRDGPQQVIPPTREEIARTIFVSNIPAGVGGDEGMQRILSAAGKLVRWTRGTDADGKLHTFGFAEYADAQSLETAAEIFKEIEVPVEPQKPGEVQEGEEKPDVKTTRLHVVVDDASVKYAEEWKRTRNEDEETVQFRLDQAKETLSQVLTSLFHPTAMPQTDHGGDATMQDAPALEGDNAEVAYLSLANAEDELADIPAEMRETVAAEIAAFRDRSIQRDRERLRREEELEAEERRRRSSLPTSAPTGPGGANGIPVGPRADRGVQGAPSGPRGSQMPRDYQGNISFVNGGSMNGGFYVSNENDDDSASDSEIERRRRKKRTDEANTVFQKELTRWQKLESRSMASLGRTSDRAKNQEAAEQAARDAQAKELKEFDDHGEAAAHRHLYYRDHSEYMRQRGEARDREARLDAADRADEERELASQQKQKEQARGQADAFLDRQAEEIMRNQEQQREPAAHFKISLGAAARKLEKTAAPRRTAADIENLLEDEEPSDQAATKKRTLVPINFDAVVRANLTQEEIEDMQRQLARDIPSDKEGLWKWPVSWENLSDKHIDKDIRDWSENKVLELMGVQEDLLVEAIVSHLRNKGHPQSLVENLELVQFPTFHPSITH